MPYILLIEDNPGDARLIRELLSETTSVTYSFTIKHVERVSDAVELLSQPHKFDLILSDITLPDSQGMETLSALNRVAIDLPVMFMTGTNDEALAIAAIHQGAQDYLVKGRDDGNALAKSIQYAIERKRFQKDLDDIRLKRRADEQHIKLLADQKRQLIALSRAKDEFVSLASHQLRTPATAVKQYLGLIIEGHVGEVSGRIGHFLRQAYNSNERELTVINDLLKTAQLDADNFRLKLASENITDIISQILADFKPTLDLKRQTVEFDPVKAYLARIDRPEIKLVLENIVENAIKYTPDGKGIAIRLSKAGGKLVISVSDEGVGISEADQKRIFDKFTRIDNELSDTVSGTGLGLYWAERIIRLHKGSINVTSALGHGSTFTLRIPTS